MKERRLFSTDRDESRKMLLLQRDQKGKKELLSDQPYSEKAGLKGEAKEDSLSGLQLFSAEAS
jgi:hypothetical protein